MPGKCKLQLYDFNDGGKPELKRRTHKFLHTDDDDESSILKGVYTEMNFTNPEQHVQKSETNLFSIPMNEECNADYYFLHPLGRFN